VGVEMEEEFTGGGSGSFKVRIRTRPERVSITQCAGIATIPDLLCHSPCIRRSGNISFLS
jgi:hypothetical protein